MSCSKDDRLRLLTQEFGVFLTRNKDLCRIMGESRFVAFDTCNTDDPDATIVTLEVVADTDADIEVDIFFRWFSSANYSVTIRPAGVGLKDVFDSTTFRFWPTLTASNSVKNPNDKLVYATEYAGIQLIFSKVWEKIQSVRAAENLTKSVGGVQELIGLDTPKITDSSVQKQADIFNAISDAASKKLADITARDVEFSPETKPEPKPWFFDKRGSK